MKEWYREDLAYIHNVGHGDFALESAPCILEILDQSGIREGPVVDLGCGSGLWAWELTKAHYDVLGVDISESMIGIVRRRVPDAEFQVTSLFKVDIPPCDAVTSLGECFNSLCSIQITIAKRWFGSSAAYTIPWLPEASSSSTLRSRDRSRKEP
jgi:SAM-dependent methyltransferase